MCETHPLHCFHVLCFSLSIHNTDTTAKRETGREAQLGNIAAAKTLADVIRTCLGPKSMLKMVLDAMGGVALTNDGNAILRVCFFEPSIHFPFSQMAHTER